MTNQRPAPEADPATRPDMEAILGGHRMRRNRRTDWSRRLVRENTLTVDDLIWPIFLIDGEGVTEPVPSMPDIERLTVDLLVERVAHLETLGIPAVALFPIVPAHHKSTTAEEAWNEDGLVPRAVRAVKESHPHIGVITDVALDPYTSHGQDGLADEHGYIVNDATVEALVKQALCQARAGADVRTVLDVEVARRDVDHGREVGGDVDPLAAVQRAEVERAAARQLQGAVIVHRDLAVGPRGEVAATVARDDVGRDQTVLVLLDQDRVRDVAARERNRETARRVEITEVGRALVVDEAAARVPVAVDVTEDGRRELLRQPGRRVFAEDRPRGH